MITADEAWARVKAAEESPRLIHEAVWEAFREERDGGPKSIVVPGFMIHPDGIEVLNQLGRRVKETTLDGEFAWEVSW